jgi:hypothetical protein
LPARTRDEVAQPQREVAEVDHHLRDRRRVRRDAVEQTPLAQPSRSVPMDVVAVRDVAWKRGAIDEKNFAPRLASSIASGAPAQRAPTR